MNSSELNEEGEHQPSGDYEPIAGRYKPNLTTERTASAKPTAVAEIDDACVNPSDRTDAQCTRWVN
ncbi:MAG TPA: hypothetical protein VN956_08675 [Pyrinomonadaceae bacterium]|nr:hypothetical protein [Pyrinomonadaceae bacterium]